MPGFTHSRMDRRTAIKWLAAATASFALADLRLLAKPAEGSALGYGMNPDMSRIYHPGELWPLTFTSEQRAAVVALCDLIIPAEGESPSASAVGVADFIDEWISAPYDDARSGGPGRSDFVKDRTLILEGLVWLDGKAAELQGRLFAGLTVAAQTEICDEICYLPRAKPECERAATFFARFRDLAAGGFYTSPEGRKDLKYVGNVPLAQFDGPPPEVLRQAGLA